MIHEDDWAIVGDNGYVSDKCTWAARPDGIFRGGERRRNRWHQTISGNHNRLDHV